MKTRLLFHGVLEVEGDARQDVIYVPVTLIVPGHTLLKRRLEVRLQVIGGTAHEVYGSVRLFLTLESVTEPRPQKFLDLKEHVGLTSVREVFAFVDPRLFWMGLSPLLGLFRVYIGIASHSITRATVWVQTVPTRLVLGKHVKFLVFQALWTIFEFNSVYEYVGLPDRSHHPVFYEDIL